MQALLDTIVKEVKPYLTAGRVADYIPALANVNPDQFGIAVCTTDGKVYQAGQAKANFSIQSISKVFALTMAIKRHGETIFERVGVDPSGMPFNSLAQLESERGIPRNPFINPGAIVVTDILCSCYVNPTQAMVELLRSFAARPNIYLDKKVWDSEWNHRSRNAAAAYLMKSFGNIHNDVEKMLRAYFSFCAIGMSCVDLAKASLFLANKGISYGGTQNIALHSRYIDAEQARRICGLMLTSGMYDAAGDFAYRVGLPAKSGVGGGIIALIPGKLAVCVWSPGLDETGNSLAGVKALEIFAQEQYGRWF